MKLCNYRADRNKTSDCWLRLDELHGKGFDGKKVRMVGEDGHRTYERNVFHWDGRGKTQYKEEYARVYDLALCDDLMSRVCPFRIHTPRGPYECKNKPLEKCKYCGNRHYGNSQARQYCENWHRAEKIFEEMFDANEKWSVHGSREDPFKEKLTPYYQQALWNSIRYKVLERDNHTCQMCGAKYEDYKHDGCNGNQDSWVIGHSLVEKDWEETNGEYKTIMRRLEPDGYHPEIYLTLEVHHIIFRENGGSDHPKNLMTTCSRCHRGWHSKHGGGSRNLAKRAQRNKHLEEWD